MTKSPSINKITLYNILSTFFLQGINFLTAPIISRMLGTDSFGVVSVYVTWVSLVSIVFSLQTDSTIAVFKISHSEKEQAKYESSILFLSIASYVLLSAVVLILIRPISKLLELDYLIIVFLLLHGLGMYLTNFVVTKFTHEFKAKYNFIITVIISIITTGLSIFLIYLFPVTEKHWGRIIGLSVPYVVFGVVAFAYIAFKGKSFFSKEAWKFCLPLCLPIVAHNISNLILNHSDQIMIKAIKGDSPTGIYALAYSFGTVISILWSAFNSSWVPFYYKYSKEENYGLLIKKGRNYAELFTVLSIGFVLLTREVYCVFASQDYWNGLNLIPIFAIGFYSMFMYSFPVNYEFYSKKTKNIAIGTVLSALINIALNYLLIHLVGLLGAAIATAICYFFQFIFHQTSARIIERKKTKYPFSFKFFLPYFLVFILSIFAFYLFADFWRIRWAYALLIGTFELWRVFKRKSIY